MAMNMQAMVQQIASMSEEQREQLLSRMTPEQRQQAIQMHSAMMDMQHLMGCFAADPQKPDEPYSTFAVLHSLASCPTMRVLGDPPAAAVLDAIEAALADDGAFDASERQRLGGLPPPVRRTLLLLYWQLYSMKLKEVIKTPLDEAAEQQWDKAQKVATGVLMKAQMMIPNCRRPQPCLALARVSALLVNSQWDHDDSACKAMMAAVLQSDGLPPPQLRLMAACAEKETGNREVLAGKLVEVRVELHRDHAETSTGGGADGATPAIATSQMNPHGILEAYWLYIEGVKPEGTPNSLIAAQPVVVKDLREAVVRATQAFMAPPDAGTYNLRIHLTSTSVTGVNLAHDCTFTVVEDDVPALV